MGPSFRKQLNRAVSRGGAAKGQCPAFEMRLDIKVGVHMPLYEHVMIARQDLTT